MPIQPIFTPLSLTLFRAAEGPRQTATSPHGVLFSDAKYAGLSMAQFIASADFHRCQQEYAALIDRIVNFFERHADQVTPPLSAAACETVRDNFVQLKMHLADRSEDFFSTHKKYGLWLGQGNVPSFRPAIGRSENTFAKTLECRFIDGAGSEQMCGWLADGSRSRHSQFAATLGRIARLVLALAATNHRRGDQRTGEVPSLSTRQ